MKYPVTASMHYRSKMKKKLDTNYNNCLTQPNIDTLSDLNMTKTHLHNLPIQTNLNTTLVSEAWLTTQSDHMHDKQTEYNSKPGLSVPRVVYNETGFQMVIRPKSY